MPDPLSIGTPLYGFQGDPSKGIGSWMQTAFYPDQANMLAQQIGGLVFLRPGTQGTDPGGRTTGVYDVYWPVKVGTAIPKPAPQMYTPSFPTPAPKAIAPSAPNFSAAPIPHANDPLPPGMLKNIVDGFTYNTMLFPYLANRYFPMALGQMDILRRAANLRARWFVIPDDIDQPLQPFDTLYFQVNVAGGSYLWGYQFSSISALDPTGAPVATTAADVCVQAVDSCTGIPLFMDFANGGGCNSNFTSRCVPILLTQPRLILEPGLVNVQLSNRTPNTITCQLLIHFAEPCKVITEEDRQKEFSLQRRVNA